MAQNESAIDEVAKELLNQERALMHADEAMDRAITLYNLAARRYAAVRDMVEEMLGGTSPYSPSSGLMPIVGSEEFSVGRYRYLFKSVGDAVYEALGDAEEPLGIHTLVVRLAMGGLQTDARAVNASLLNMRGVGKLPGRRYAVTPPEDDLPF